MANLGTMVFTDETKPTNITIENYNLPNMIESALVESSYIEKDPAEEGDKCSRISFDSNIRKAYINRKDEIEDSLRSIRAYNYLNPTSAIIVPIPEKFTIDKEVTLKTYTLLKEAGLNDSTIESMIEQRESVKNHCLELYDIQLANLPEDKKEDTRTLDFLRKTYLEVPSYPYIRLATKEEDEAPLRVTKGKNSIYYALSTSVPLNISDDIIVKSYLGGCIHYMLWQIEKVSGLKSLDESKHVYYDYYIVENSTVYFFINVYTYK